MKKLMPIILAALILAGCSKSDNSAETEISESSAAAAAAEAVPETTASAAETSAERTETTSAETASVTTAFAAEEKLPIDAESRINADGTLNEAFTERLINFAMPTEPVAIGIFPALWDFDEDGVPEIILTYHNGGQGRMPSHVYSAETLEEIGEFKGFCRDGFTRFINKSDGSAVIYNFYEHSNWERFESVENVKIENGKLVSQSEAIRNWSNNEEYNPRLELWKGGSTSDERWEPGYINMTAEYYEGNVCTSFDDRTYDTKAASENAVESYNNYIRSRALLKNDIDRLLIFGDKNQYAFFQTEEGCFFIDENGEKALLKEGWAYFDLYTLWDDIIVCQPLGNTQPCDVYVMTDGKPALDEKLSGHGMCFDYSHFYNCRFELTESVYDGVVDENGKSMGTHTFKKYTFYQTKDGFREYGSIVVPMDEFMKLYGDDIKTVADELAENDTEICEVLYRGDGCFILNCRETIFLDEEKTQPAGAYRTKNITLKPNRNKGGLSEVYRDYGVYKTALIPEIAVYPEKYYTEDAEWDKCVVY